MARISAKTLNLQPSPSPDVVGYRMYYTASGGAGPDYTSPFIELDASLSYDLSLFVELSTLDGDFDVNFTAIDDQGNESDMGAPVQSVPFDFVAPDAPTGATFENG